MQYGHHRKRRWAFGFSTRYLSEGYGNFRICNPDSWVKTSAVG
jgi:hypothetical protein